MSLVQQRLRQQRMEKEQLRRDFTKVKKLIADGKMQEARDILAHVIETTKNEKAKAFAQAWLDRLTLPKPGRFANYQRVVKWISGAAVLLMVGSVLIYVVISRFQWRDFAINWAVQMLCGDVYFDVYVDQGIPASDFVDACEEEADRVMTLYAAEVEYCYDRTQHAQLERQFMNCLADNDVQFSGRFIREAIP